MVDVTVCGAGVFGLSIAFSCARRGAKVQVIDPHGVGSGASGGVVGALAPHVPENWNEKKAFQLESLLMSEAYWADVDAYAAKLSARELYQTGYSRSGRVQMLSDEGVVDRAVEREQSAKTLWQGRASWSVQTRQVGGRFKLNQQLDWQLNPNCKALIYDDLSALINPLSTVKALAAATEAFGVSHHTNAPLQGKVVWATGWQGLEEMTRRHHRSVGGGMKGQAALLELSAAGRPQLFGDGLHIVPHLDGTVAIGSTSERDFEDPSSTDAALDVLIEKACDLAPELKGARVLKRWANIRPRARSRAPMLGNHPFEPSQFVANGGFKIGFGMAPLCAEVMADLILEGYDRIPDSFKAEASL